MLMISKGICFDILRMQIIRSCGSSLENADIPFLAQQVS